MNEYQQIVDDIQTLLVSEQEIAVTEFTVLHDQYTEALKGVNRRLRDCDELLKKGHRSEAIQQCETEPNLLDTVTVLDFPEKEAWDQFTKRFNLPVTPQLLISVKGLTHWPLQLVSPA